MKTPDSPVDSTLIAPPTLLGLRTVIYAAPELDKLKEWYTSLLGFAPYFEEPFYVGFNVGGYELGLDPDARIQPGSTLTYWGVNNLQLTYDRLLSLGASPDTPIVEVGAGIQMATLKDPAGNVLGLIENAHFRVQ